MHFKIGDWKVSLRSVIRIEWRKYYPKLIVHERFESYVKWTLRILTAIGILTSFLTLPYWAGIIMTFVLFGVEQFIERVLFEYTILVIQHLPRFQFDPKEWYTNGYLLLSPEVPNDGGYLNYFGPVFKSKEYAENFISYLSTWNRNEKDDKDNNIIISFILEPNHQYTTYFYANSQRKWLNEIFEREKEKKKLDKYGKQAQEYVMQTIFCKTIPLTKDMFFYKFRDQQKQNEPFNFCTFVQDENNNLIPIDNFKIVKYHFTIRGRWNLNENDAEYHIIT